MAEDEKGFLTRWSKRKRAPEADAPVEPQTMVPAPEAEAAAEAQRNEEEINRLAAEAVDIDAMTYEDDFTIFQKPGVPEFLKRRALRKFFGSNPLLANLDGLNDYDEDYNNPAHMVYKSVWSTARGFLTEAEDVAQKLTGRISSAVAKLEELAPDEVTPEVLETSEPETAAIAEPPTKPGQTQEQEVTVPPRVSIRRRLEG